MANCISFVFIIIYSSLFCYTTFAENHHLKQNELANKLQTLLQHTDLKNASIGLSVVSAEGNELIFSHQPDKILRVASNMKLLTTSAALLFLGKDFMYKTWIYTTGNLLPNRELSGDVIIIGSGDPNISGRFYDGNITAVPEIWADRIEGIGIKAVNGDIIADDTIFDREYVNPTWPANQLSNWYCAQISGLAFNDNCIDITISPGIKEGQLVKSTTNPKTDYVNIINKCITTKNRNKHSYSLYRKKGTNNIYLTGNFWIGANRQLEWVTIDNPPLYLANIFKEILERRNITVKGGVRFVNKQDMEDIKNAKELLCTVSSIEQTIEITNKRSQNFYAEQILKTLGTTTKKKGSFRSGLKIIKKLIRMLGHNPDEYEIADGSGLSRKNKLTANLLTDLLCFMYKHEYNDIFINSLPVSGLSGTLRKRLKEAPFKSRVKAKTGYIAGTSAISGYVETIDGYLLAFSILVNDFKVSNRNIKKIQDSICKVLVGYSHSHYSSK